MDTDQLEILILSLLIIFMLGAIKASADELRDEYYAEQEGQ
jgi:hypothetical protein